MGFGVCCFHASDSFDEMTERCHELKKFEKHSPGRTSSSLRKRQRMEPSIALWRSGARRLPPCQHLQASQYYPIVTTRNKEKHSKHTQIVGLNTMECKSTNCNWVLFLFVFSGQRGPWVWGSLQVRTVEETNDPETICLVFSSACRVSGSSSLVWLGQGHWTCRTVRFVTEICQIEQQLRFWSVKRVGSNETTEFGRHKWWLRVKIPRTLLPATLHVFLLVWLVSQKQIRHAPNTWHRGFGPKVTLQRIVLKTISFWNLVQTVRHTGSLCSGAKIRGGSQLEATVACKCLVYVYILSCSQHAFVWEGTSLVQRIVEKM